MNDHFFQIPENPAPEGGRSGYFVARDRKNIRYALFPATGRPLLGTVLLLHGRNEAIEKYFETIRDLQARGLGVATFDWRGQGGSDRLLRDPLPGHVASFEDYVRDMEQFIGEILLPDCRGPFFLLAHSTGALVALLGAHVLTNRVERMVLAAPLLAIEGLPMGVDAVRRWTAALCRLGLGRRMLFSRRPLETAPFPGNKLTSDPVRYARNARLYEAHPQLALGGPTVSWVHAACVAAQKVQDREFMAGIRVPSLFVAAGADEVVSTRAVIDYARKLRSGLLLTVDGARHEIMQEADLYRAPFLAAFDAFVPGSAR